MVNTEDKKYQKFVQQCADFCKKTSLSTQKAIYEWMLADLMENYKGKAPKWKIESVAEDVTESICLKMNIKQTGIR